MKSPCQTKLHNQGVDVIGSYNYGVRGFTESQEDKTKRTLTSKHFKIADNQFIGIFHCKPVHYFDEATQQLQTIDLTLVDDGTNYLMEKNKFSVGFRKDKSKSKYLGLRKGYDYQFEASISKIVLNGKELAFSEFAEITKLNDYELKHKITNDIWVHNRLHECYVKEALVINTANVPVTDLEIWYELEFKGFIEEDISGTTFRYKKDDSDKFWIPTPEMWVEGEATQKHHTLQHRIEKLNGKVYYVKSLSTEDKKWVSEQANKTIYFDATTYYSTTADGYIWHGGSSWSTIRGAATGTVADYNDTYDNLVNTTYVEYSGGTYYIFRSFFYFDTSGIPDDATITSATINLHCTNKTINTPVISAQKGTQGDTLATADYDSFTGDSYGTSNSWTTSSYGSISFNATGLSDISLTGTTKVCCREYTHDYLNSAADGKYGIGITWADNTGTTQDPYLSIEYTVSTAYDELVSASLGLSASVSTQSDFVRSVSASLGLSASVSKSRKCTKGVSASLGLSASVSTQSDFVRSVSASLGLSADVWLGYISKPTAKLGLSASVTTAGVWASAQYWKIVVQRGSNSYDLTNLNIVKSAKFSDRIGKRADEFDIEIYNNSGAYNDAFDVGDVVLIYFDTDESLSNPTVVFRGYVTNIEVVSTRPKENTLLLQGEDYGSVRLRQELMVGVYEKVDTSISDILKDVISLYTPDITTTAVSTFSTNVDYLRFSWQTVWQAVDFLANLAGADYYVDENCDLHFFDSQSQTSTHTFTDSHIQKLKVKRDSTKAFDKVYVVGGKEPHADVSNTTTTTATKIHDKYYATKFTPSFSNLLQMEIYINNVGTPTTNIDFEIVKDNSGPAGDIAAYGTIQAVNSSSSAGWVKSTIIDARLEKGVDYWLVIPMVGDADHTYEVYVDTTETGHKYSTDKSSWSDGTGKIAFKTYYGTQVIKSAIAASKIVGERYTQNALVDFTIKDTTTAQELATQKIDEYSLKNATDMTIWSIYDRVRSGDLITINSTLCGINEDQVILSTEYTLDSNEAGYSSTVRISCTKSDDFFIHFAKMFEELRKAKVEQLLESQSVSVDYQQVSETISISLTETIDEVLTSASPAYDDDISRWDVSKWK